MTKQEEIKGEIYRILYDVACSPYPERGGLLENRASQILAYLHSQGVVIKVERELPPRYFANRKKMPWVSDYDVEKNTQEEMLKAGYVAVEPLIEESK